MYPILLDLSFFRLKSLTVFAILALFFSAFVFWRKGREEHYNLFEIFDAYVLSLLFAYVIGRLTFVALNWPLFANNLWAIFDVIHKPGSELFLSLLASAIYLYRYATKRKWDGYEILDFWATALSLGLALVYLGFFLDGSYGGQFTNLPWGVIIPGNFEKTHPAQLYFAIFYLLLYSYLYKMEYQYRTLDWYRGGKKTAQSGFLFSAFLIAISSFHLLLSPVTLPSVVIAGQVMDQWLYLLLLIFSLLTMFWRSGRSFRQNKRP